MKRDTAAVRALVDQKVDVNVAGKDGTPALHWLVRVDDVDTARLLLRAGADAKRANRTGVTPLYLACANGNAAMIRLLLDAGADPNAPDPDGRNALDDGVEGRQPRLGDAAARTRRGGRCEGSRSFNRPR